MNLDDLLKSIREEDDDSKGAKIDPEKFLKRKTFENPLKGQRFTAPSIPSAGSRLKPQLKPVVVTPDVKNVDNDKLLPSSSVLEQYNKKIDELIEVIREDNQLELNKQRTDQLQNQRNLRQQREKRIELGKLFKSSLNELTKRTKPFVGFFDRLKNFLGLTLLSGLISVLYNFFKDPQNVDKVEAIRTFLVNYWPAVLGAVAYFFTPFGSLVNFVIGTVGKFLIKLGLLAAKHPILAAALGVGIGTKIMMDRSKAVAEEIIERKEKEAGRELTPKEQADELSKPSSILESFVKYVLPSLIGRPVEGRSGGGLTMGTDTVPALLTPGEFIMSKGAVQKFGVGTMMAMNKAGGGTNRPKFGRVLGFQGGGYVDFAKEMVKQHEGYNIKDGMHHAYRDSKGLPTIGYGHLITPGDGYSMSSRISQKEADSLFDKDFKYHRKHAEKIPGFAKASDQQKAALIDLTFNMGPSWHVDFPGFVKAFAAGDYETAANEIRYKDASSPNLQDSKYYKDVKPRRGDPIISLIRGTGVGNAPHLKQAEKLLPVDGDPKTQSPPTPQTQSPPTPPPLQTPKSSDFLGPAFGTDVDAYVNAPRREYQRFGRQIEMQMRRFVLPVGTPNVPTSSKTIFLPPVETEKPQTQQQNTVEVPNFKIQSGAQMRGLISKSLNIADLVGAS